MHLDLIRRTVSNSKHATLHRKHTSSRDRYTHWLCNVAQPSRETVLSSIAPVSLDGGRGRLLGAVKEGSERWDSTIFMIRPSEDRHFRIGAKVPPPGKKQSGAATAPCRRTFGVGLEGDRPDTLNIERNPTSKIFPIWTRASLLLLLVPFSNRCLAATAVFALLFRVHRYDETFAYFSLGLPRKSGFSVSPSSDLFAIATT